LVTGVLEGGPASQAGIRPGDVITRINESRPRDAQELMATIANQPPGTTLLVGGWRGSEALSLEVISGQRPVSQR
jgi:S1-C subfamily serine protease